MRHMYLPLHACVTTIYLVHIYTKSFIYRARSYLMVRVKVDQKKDKFNHNMHTLKAFTQTFPLFSTI